MPGLKEAGKNVNDLLKEDSAKYGYVLVPRVPALWLSTTKDLMFPLCIDGFDIKSTSKQMLTIS